VKEMAKRLVWSELNETDCLIGSYCSHAILTKEIGVYRCPFGECFKKSGNQERLGSAAYD